MSDEMRAGHRAPTPDSRVPLDDVLRQLDRQTSGHVPSPTLSEGLSELKAWMSHDGTTSASAQQPSRDPFEDSPPVSPPAPVRVLIAAGNPVVRAGLTALISSRTGITVVAEASDVRHAWEVAAHLQPDVVLLDSSMPNVDGISALPYLVQIAPVVMLTHSHESEIVREALRRGASDYLVHGEFSAHQLVETVRNLKEARAHAPAPVGSLTTLPDVRPQHGPRFPEGLDSATAHDTDLVSGPTRDNRPTADRTRYQLNSRETEIMNLIASGMSDRQIAASCFISEKTVKNHIHRIFAKLHSTGRDEATAEWLNTGSDTGR